MRLTRRGWMLVLLGLAAWSIGIPWLAVIVFGSTIFHP